MEEEQKKEAYERKEIWKNVLVKGEGVSEMEERLECCSLKAEIKSERMFLIRIRKGSAFSEGHKE